MPVHHFSRCYAEIIEQRTLIETCESCFVVRCFKEKSSNRIGVIHLIQQNFSAQITGRNRRRVNFWQDLGDWAKDCEVVKPKDGIDCYRGRIRIYEFNLFGVDCR